MNRNLFAAAACGAMFASAAVAQDAAAPAAAPAAPAMAPVAVDEPPIPEGSWGWIADSSEVVIFVGLDAIEGSDSSTTAVGMTALRTPRDTGFAAQMTYYNFNCNTERYRVIGMRQLNADGTNRVYQAQAESEELRWRDDDVAEAVGRIACDEDITNRSYSTLAAALAEAQN